MGKWIDTCDDSAPAEGGEVVELAEQLQRIACGALEHSADVRRVAHAAYLLRTQAAEVAALRAERLDMLDQINALGRDAEGLRDALRDARADLLEAMSEYGIKGGDALTRRIDALLAKKEDQQ